MNRIGRYIAIVVLASVIFSCAATSDIKSDKGACILKAADSDVYIKVFDLDRSGNMGPLIWQGRINQGQTARIKTTQAYFRFFYNAEPDVAQPLHSGMDKACDDLDIVPLP